MGRLSVLQISGINSDLMGRIDKYRDDEELKTRSEAGRALIEFALRVIEHSEGDEGVSTREILEENLRVAALNSKMLDNIFFQTFDESRYSSVADGAKKRKQAAKERAEQYVDDFLSGKKEGG